MPATMAPTERTSGATQPRSNAYFRNKAAAMSSAATPIASRPRCPNHCSRSVFWEGSGSDAVGTGGAGLLRGAGRIAGACGVALATKVRRRTRFSSAATRRSSCSMASFCSSVTRRRVTCAIQLR